MTPKSLQNGKYRIVRVLGQGGFGITYEGVQTGLNRRVAIKEFFMSDYCEREEGSSRVSIVGTKGNREMVERFREKFLKEAQMIAGLDDVPHIIRIYDVFQENGTAYYVMQYIDGGSLRSLVKQRGRLDEATAKRYIAQVAEALAELHKRRIMHLDVKPDNILLKDGEAILIDFGVSKHYDQGGDATTTTPVGRSKGYAPLEQYKQGGVQSFSPETDIYSLGATLYFLLTGQDPPEATELVAKPIDCPSYISANLREAISKAMQADKDKRLQSLRGFTSLLQEGFPITKPRENTIYDEVSLASLNSGSSKGPQASSNTEPIITESLIPNKDGIKEVFTKLRRLSFSGTIKKYGIASFVVLITLSLLGWYYSSNNSNKVENLQGKTNPVIEQLIANMVYVEGGVFTMGATSEQESVSGYEKPIHQVTLSSFSIGKYEVTQEEWETVMGSNPSRFKGAKRPVEKISWDDCQEFISKLNNLTGRRFRLPTEAEWEYAARGGQKSRGYKYSGSNTLSGVAWFDENSGDETHEVGQKRPNELGLYDMSGNVWEWCGDWFGEYDSAPQTNPTGPTTGSRRVLRGGSWGSYATFCRVANRDIIAPSYRRYYYGFRLAL